MPEPIDDVSIGDDERLLHRIRPDDVVVDSETGQRRRRRGHENPRRLRLLHRISRRALLPRRQVLSDRRRLNQRAKDDHRPGRAGVSEGEPMNRVRTCNMANCS